MHVKTDYDGCPYISAGRVYEVKSSTGDLIRDYIEDDGGRNMEVQYCWMSFCCVYHEGHSILFVICDENGNEVWGFQ